MRLSFCFFVLVICTASFNASYGNVTDPQSQQDSLDIKGIIKDDKDQGLAGVTISVKGKTSTVQSDADGSFLIKANAGDVLVLTRIGYQTIEIPVSGTMLQNIVMHQQSVILGEVVVTALGLEKEKRTLAYSTQSVKPKTLTQAREVNLLNALQGKVAGLNIGSGSSGIGSSSRVILRGNRSINGNSQPLYVVDGIQVGDISHVNPDNIASLNVLKGANAAALYGSAGQNGVIIIETKKGTQGQFVSLSSTYMVSQAENSIPYQYEYGQGINGIYNKSIESVWGPRLKDTLVDSWSLVPGVAGTKYPFLPQTGVRDAIFRSGYNSATNLLASMGSEKLQGIINYTYTNAAGIVPLNALKRHNMSARLSGKLAEKLRFDTKLEYMRQNINNDISEGESSYNPFRQIYTTPPNIRLEDLKQYEFINSSGLPQQNYWSTVITGANPYWTIYRNLRKAERSQFVSMGTLSYMITNDLKAMLRGSYIVEHINADEKSFYGTFREPFGSYSIVTGKGITYSGEALLNYTKQFSENWSINGEFGGEIRHNRSSSFAASTGAALNIPNVFSISNTQLPIVSNSFSEFESQSLLYGLKFGWKKAIFLEHTGRNDWNSTLPSVDRSFFYPSLGLTAVLTDLLSFPQAFDYLKLRGSLAQVGNGTQPYQLSRYATSISGGATGYILLSSTLPNKTLKPERTISKEIGLELSMFSNRLGIDLTLYKTNTNNQLFSQAIPVGSGALSYLTNGGDVQNKGLEVILSTRPVSSKNFKWDLNFNYAINKSLVKRLSDRNNRLVIGTDTYMRDFVLEAGKPFGLMYGKGFQRDSLGRVLVNSATGLPQVTAGRTVLLGNINPLWTGGLMSIFTYKKWTAGFVVTHKQGGSIASYTDAILYGDGLVEGTLLGRESGLVFGQNIFQEQKVVNADGSNTTKSVTAQQLWGLLANRNTPVAEVLMKSATNTRLREAYIGYTFSKPEVGNWKFSSIELSVVGRNLFFIHRASPTIDPDFMVGTGTVSEGFQSFAPPTTKSYGLNVKVNF